MGNRRTPTVLAALGLGAVAAIAIWAYLGGVEERAFQGARLASVFVVKDDIRQGTAADRAISEGRIVTDQIPAKFRPPNAINDLELIRGKVAATNLLPGQIVSREYFSTARTASSFAPQIPEGQVAISVQVDRVHGVAHLVRPGDKVNIVVITPEGARTLFQNVDVIAIGASVPSVDGDGQQQATTPEENGLVTFAVPLAAAQKIALAASTASTTPEGGLYLTLVPPENQTVSVPPLTAGNLFQGSLTPYA